MKPYFAETSYWLALELNDDQNHEAALKHWQNLVQTTFSTVTTFYVFDETIKHLNKSK